MKYIKLTLAIIASFALLQAAAEENKGVEKSERKQIIKKKLAEGCEPATAQVDLDVNNVRARINNGGDMWWDLVAAARYEIPKVTNADETRRHSLFAGALWIGGFDQGNNLRAAAMTYRQSGSDFYPGALDTASASIQAEGCEKWDRIWKVSKDEIEAFREDPINNITEDIRTWPTKGDVTVGEQRYLAPFVDVDNDGVYDPNIGDYPDILGDQALWFVYNDKGNIHQETQATSIGLEVQTMAFAFQQSNEINNMTFYQQKVINRSKDKLDSMFFGQWVDADLGFAYDDYVGCDVERNLGICYNGDAFDEGVNGYGNNPPSVGVDFFQGPVDENGEEIGMEYFVYYDNDFSPYGNPEEAAHYYNYLTGTWKNGDRVTFGGDGRTGSDQTNYMFPDDPRDPTGWSEVTAGNQPFDRRFLQSAGPFTLLPGAVNFITVGVVWARATTGGNTGSYDQLLIADDKAQRLYNNDFEILDGPSAPDVTIQELDKEIILSFENYLTPETELYQQDVISTDGKSVIKYSFQGYEIYQLADATVQASELRDPDRARLFAQVDVEDRIDVLVNKIFDPETAQENAQLMIRGENEGVRHTFNITADLFASGEDELVNNRAYYFMVIAYAAADPDDSVSANADEQYIQGRFNSGALVAYPHNPNVEYQGAVVKAQYGDRPQVTRYEGFGNGGMILDLSEESRQEILENGFDPSPTYAVSGGPIDFKVFDPLLVEPNTYTLLIQDSTIDATSDALTQLNGQSRWVLQDQTSGETINSDTTINYQNEQVFPERGVSATIQNTRGPNIRFPDRSEDQGLIEATLEFEDEDERWLTGIADVDAPQRFTDDDLPYALNWIRSGKTGTSTSANSFNSHDANYTYGNDPDSNNFIDPSEVYESLLDGIIAPYSLTARTVAEGSRFTFGPAIEQTSYVLGNIEMLSSTDIVFTSNKENWSRTIVLEMGENAIPSEGDVNKFGIRAHASWTDPNAIDSEGNPQYDQSETGRSFFPGYAINLETGERLNVIFGEDSWFKTENGADMLWNPTNTVASPAAGTFDYDRWILGGKHWTYVQNSFGLNGRTFVEGARYDEGSFIRQLLTREPINLNRRLAGYHLMWTMLPQIAENYDYLPLEDGFIPTDATIRLRIAQPYHKFDALDGNNENNGMPRMEVSTESLAREQSESMAKSMLDFIKVVPNPYYAFSGYENNQLDNRVRFTNLPQQCTISIYTQNGQLVRRLEKDQNETNHVTYLDWDIKNDVRIPVSSGLYMIHIEAPGIGERTLKWFATTRPLDLDTF